MTLKITVFTGKLYRPSQSTAIKITSKDGRVFTTRFSQGDNPQWYDSFECSITEKQLHFTIIQKANQFNKDIFRQFGKTHIIFDEKTFTPRVQVSRQISLMDEELEVCQVKMTMLYNPALKFIGAEKKKGLDLSDAKLTYDPKRSRTLVSDGRVEQNGNTTTNTNVNVNITNPDKSKVQKSQTANDNPTIQHHTFGNQSDIHITHSMENVDTSGILKIHANKVNLFSWMDDFSQKLSFEFVPKKIRKV